MWVICIAAVFARWLSTSKTSISKVSWTKVQPVGNSDKFAAREIAMWSAKDYIITWT